MVLSTISSFEKSRILFRNHFVITMKSMALRLISLVFLLFGGLFLYAGVRNILFGDASKNWPTVPGKIISSTVASRQGRERTSKHRDKEVTNYYAEVRYEYTVNGKTRTSNAIAYGGYSLSKDPSQVQVIVDKYPVGSPVTAYYSPSHPSMAVLEPGIRDHGFFPLLFGAFFFGMGSLAFIFPRRRSNNGVTQE